MYLPFLYIFSIVIENKEIIIAARLLGSTKAAKYNSNTTATCYKYEFVLVFKKFSKLFIRL